MVLVGRGRESRVTLFFFMVWAFVAGGLTAVVCLIREAEGCYFPYEKSSVGRLLVGLGSDCLRCALGWARAVYARGVAAVLRAKRKKRLRIGSPFWEA